MSTETYRGHRILPVFDYKTPTGEYLYSDFQVYPKDSEKGYLESKRTIEEVRQAIDEQLPGRIFTQRGYDVRELGIGA